MSKRNWTFKFQQKNKNLRGTKAILLKSMKKNLSKQNYKRTKFQRCTFLNKIRWTHLAANASATEKEKKERERRS